ncbi:MAG TPA: alkylhydroperoxidase-related (seleno)protein, partial [Reyranella sp.]|nr:alkylhydroperoxidase-related (seleno)protein [Reyranella sp.]
MRQELQDAIASAARALGQPGVWWTGAERLKIASETRRARSCALCRRRKEAFSPHSLTGSHDSATDLPPSAIEAVHRIVSDPGRLSE